MGICLSRKPETCLLSSVTELPDLADDSIIVLRTAHNSHRAPVLRGAAEHGRASDVNVLNGILHSHARLRYGLAERIEIDAHHVDESDSVLLELRDMAFKVTAAKKSSMHFRMESLDAAVTNLRKTCNLADVYNIQSRILQELHSASGSDDFPSQSHKLTGEFYHAGLITYAE